MNGYIDIHTHILPGVDDGSRDEQASIRMLSDAYADGTREMILTPHYKQRYRCGGVTELVKRFERFQAVASEQTPILLHLGTEAMYEIDLPKKLMDGEVLTLAGTKYVLIEFMPNVRFEYLSSGVFELLCCGYVPVVAHIERYHCLNKRKVAELVHLGAKLQINAGSVLGRAGLRAKWFCSGAIKNGAVDFISSDAHDPVSRTARLAQAADHVSQKFGEICMRQLFSNNAENLLKDE